MNEFTQRAAVVAEGISWLNTPFAHRQMLKGRGVDCLRLPISCYWACGLLANVTPADIPDYSAQFGMHRDDEPLYREHLAKHMRQFESDPQPGDLALFRLGRAYAHAVLVVNWPDIGIEATVQRGVIYVEPSRDPIYRRYEAKYPPLFFSPWPEAEARS